MNLFTHNKNLFVILETHLPPGHLKFETNPVRYQSFVFQFATHYALKQVDYYILRIFLTCQSFICRLIQTDGNFKIIFPQEIETENRIFSGSRLYIL